MYRISSVFLLFCLAAALTACDDDGQGADPTPALDMGPVVDAGPDPDAAPATLVVRGTLAAFGASTPVPDARVCLDDGEVCVTGADDGTFTFSGYPSASESYLTISAEGFLPTVVPLLVTADATFQWLLVPDTAATFIEASVGADFDPAASYLAAAAFDAGGVGVPGVTYTVEPAGSQAFYFDEMGAPDPALTEQTRAGRAGWLDLPATGVGEITLTPPEGVTCSRSRGVWPGSSDLSVRFPMRAGHIGAIFDFSCRLDNPAPVVHEHEGYLANASPSACRESDNYLYSPDEDDGWWLAARLSSDSGAEVTVDQIEYLLIDATADAQAAATGCALLDHRVRVFVGGDSPPAEPVFIFETEVTGLDREGLEDGQSVSSVVDLPPITLGPNESLYALVEGPVNVESGERLCKVLCASPGIEGDRSLETGAAELPYSWATLASYGITDVSAAIWARKVE